MRILHVIASLNPESGGPTASIHSLVAHSPSDCVNEVLTLDDPAAPFLASFPLAAPSFVLHALGPTASRYGYNRRLIPWLRANGCNYDGVIVHGLWQFCGFAVWRTLGRRQPYVVFTHGMLDPYFKRRFPFKHFKKLLYWLAAEYWVLRDAARVLFTCQTEEELARQSFRLHRWVPAIVPFGSSPPPGDEHTLREHFYARFPALKDRRLILFLGRITPKKGCDLLIDAFQSIAQANPEVDLVMAGPTDPPGSADADWQRSLRTQASEAGLSNRIHWLGMVQGDEKWGAYYASEAFILPSHQENFGISVAEAMACGRAVLLSDRINIAPEIAGGGGGLVENDTLDGTIRLLERWLALSPEAKLTMARRSGISFETHYDMRTNAAILPRLIADLRRP